MKTFLKKICLGLSLILSVFVIAGCSSEKPPAEEQQQVALPAVIEAQPAANDELIEPVSPLTQTGSNESDIAVEIEATPAPTLPTELIEPEATATILPESPLPEPDVSPNRGIAPLAGSEEPLQAALADLATKLGIAADQITLVSMEMTNWSDTSLGCAQEGMMYAQVITPGYLIMFEAAGQMYEYHTDETINVVHCESQPQ